MPGTLLPAKLQSEIVHNSFAAAVRPLSNCAREGLQVIQTVRGSAMHESEVNACIAMGDPIS
jgi:hypothetical protein